MPTFFARRYMRDRPSPRERRIGVALLGLLALIATAFLLTSGLLGDLVSGTRVARGTKAVLRISERPLFLADPANLEPPPPAHEIQAGETLLPATLDEAKRVDLQVAMVEARAEDGDELMAAAAAFGAQWLYRAGYRMPEGQVPLSARIVDAGQPEQAFGLWRARTPAAVRTVNVGRAGWLDEATGRLAFWAGRHYTELSMAPPASPALVEAAARALVRSQLVYGGPFWAESVLPQEGRIPASLRYVRQAALGLASLSDCWLADYSAEVSVGVMRPAPARREAMLRELREQLAVAPAGATDESVPREQVRSVPSEEPAYNAEPEDSGPATGLQVIETDALIADLPPDSAAGQLAGRAAVVFPAGPYLFIALGRNAAELTTLATTLHERWSMPDARLAAGSVQVASGGPSAGQARFPDLDRDDLVAPTRIERYTDNLYEKINGREGQFRAFDFVELRCGQYVNPRARQVFDVYIYDMAEPANAMGIYMTERSGEVEEIPLGRGGYTSGASVFFWKGRYYVYVLGPADGDAEAARASLAIAGAVADTIRDEDDAMWADALLPAEDRVANSLTYRASGGLGFGFIERMFLANYETGGLRYQMYLVKTDGPDEARDLFRQYAEATKRYDKILADEETPGGRTLVSDSLDVIGVAFHRGVYFGGVAECDDRELAEAKAAALRDSLPAE